MIRDFYITIKERELKKKKEKDIGPDRNRFKDLGLIMKIRGLKSVFFFGLKQRKSISELLPFIVIDTFIKVNQLFINKYSQLSELQNKQSALYELNSCCRFVVYVNGDKRITDVRGNDGLWHFLCVTWVSQNGTWAIYLDGALRDSGTGLATGAVIEGEGI